MNSEYDDKVRQHYNEVARVCGTSPTSTMADEIVRRTETDAILAFVQAAARQQQDRGRLTIVDVGCGNGYTLSRLAEACPGHKLVGVEYNAALRALAVEQASGGANVIAGDLRDLGSIDIRPGSVDILVCQRVIINLMDRGDQAKALDNIVSLVRPGGALVFIESFDRGLNNLNEARAEFGLTPINPAIHNLYLSDEFFSHPALAKADLPGFDVAPNVLSTHYYVSRVLHEVVGKAAGVQDQQRNSHFVKFLSAGLPPGVGDFSPLRIYGWSKVSP